MGTTMSASFATRREEEMTVERLVQEFGVERTDILISTEGDDNSVGVAEAGSDTEAGKPTPETREDAPLEGAIVVSVDIEDDAKLEDVRSAFAEFNADGLETR